MADETRRLGAYAAALRYEEVPPTVIQRAKDCIIDTFACIAFGATLPWSRIVLSYADHNGAGGKSHIIGGSSGITAPMAALANGALAHAFELDSLTRPNAGVHPGATLLSAALAVAHERGGSGKDLLAAFVAAAEVMIRVGLATKHSNEARGFHAPGTTGPFGGAVAAGRMLKLDVERMTSALGIAASLSAGIMEFARSGTGAMVKRLHIGRAAESGILAASLAANGFSGPLTAVEGELGFLKVFCREWDMALLTRGLGEEFVTLSILLKRYACHANAQTPIQAVEDLLKEHRYSAQDVVAIEISGNQRMATIHNIPSPTDVMMAQYSVPFSVALAHFHDVKNPLSFNEATLNDPAIRALCTKIWLVANPGSHGGLASVTTIHLKDGRILTRAVEDFHGAPSRPLDQTGLHEKYELLMQSYPRAESEIVFERMQTLEAQATLDWLHI
jgi:2-methylcitrate dehydratase PrpD